VAQAAHAHFSERTPRCETTGSTNARVNDAGAVRESLYSYSKLGRAFDAALDQS
jgi:hypothetical protein